MLKLRHQPICGCCGHDMGISNYSSVGPFQLRLYRRLPQSGSIYVSICPQTVVLHVVRSTLLHTPLKPHRSSGPIQSLFHTPLKPHRSSGPIQSLLHTPLKPHWSSESRQVLWHSAYSTVNSSTPTTLDLTLLCVVLWVTQETLWNLILAARVSGMKPEHPEWGASAEIPLESHFKPPPNVVWIRSVFCFFLLSRLKKKPIWMDLGLAVWTSPKASEAGEQSHNRKRQTPRTGKRREGGSTPVQTKQVDQQAKILEAKTESEKPGRCQ